MFISCGSGSENTETKEPIDTIKVDSLMAYFNMIDSLSHKGQLCHIDVYEIGKLGSIYFDVYNLSSDKTSAQYLNLKKDCGGSYYYDWESSKLIREEIKYFLNAIDTVMANMERTCDHEERYIYVTNDNIRLYSLGKEGKPWSVELSIDFTKSYSSISVKKDELLILKDLLKKGEEKILSLSKDK